MMGFCSLWQGFGHVRRVFHGRQQLFDSVERQQSLGHLNGNLLDLIL